jgi:hypothetical protein
MYRFDDKRRRQLLEDALVADLLDTHPRAAPSAPPESTPAPAAAPVGAGTGPKRGA